MLQILRYFSAVDISNRILRFQFADISLELVFFQHLTAHVNRGIISVIAHYAL